MLNLPFGALPWRARLGVALELHAGDEKRARQGHDLARARFCASAVTAFDRSDQTTVQFGLAMPRSWDIEIQKSMLPERQRADAIEHVVNKGAAAPAR